MREIPQCVSQLAFTVLKLLGILQYPEKGVKSILDAALAPPVSLSHPCGAQSFFSKNFGLFRTTGNVDEAPEVYILYAPFCIPRASTAIG